MENFLINLKINRIINKIKKENNCISKEYFSKLYNSKLISSFKINSYNEKIMRFINGKEINFSVI